jgi:hypothetical protein
MQKLSPDRGLKMAAEELRQQIHDLARSEARVGPKWDERLGMLVATALFLKDSAGTEEVNGTTSRSMEWMQWDDVLLSGYWQENEIGAEVNLPKVREYLDRVWDEVERQSTSALGGEQEKSEELLREIKKMRDNSDWSLKARAQWTAMVESLQSAHDKCCPGSFRACSTGQSGSRALALLHGDLQAGVSEFARTEVLDPGLKKKFVETPSSVPGGPTQVFSERFTPGGPENVSELIYAQEQKDKVRDLLYAEATRSLPGRPPCSTPGDTAQLVSELLVLVHERPYDPYKPMWFNKKIWERATEQVKDALYGVGQVEPMDSRYRAPLPRWEELVRSVHQLVAPAAVAANLMLQPQKVGIFPPCESDESDEWESTRESDEWEFQDMGRAQTNFWVEHARSHPNFPVERAKEKLRSYVNQKMQELEPLLPRLQASRR